MLFSCAKLLIFECANKTKDKKKYLILADFLRENGYILQQKRFILSKNIIYCATLATLHIMKISTCAVSEYALNLSNPQRQCHASLITFHK